MSADRILIDTSVWIDYFRNKSVVFVEFVQGIVKAHEICVPRIVLAELMQGAKSEKELSVIAAFMEAFTIIDQTEQTWLRAGRASYELKKKGKSVNLTDCYIAVIAKENGCCVFTLDRHFKDLGPHLGIELLNPVNEQSAQRKPLNSR
jgi:hypothetical protein